MLLQSEAFGRGRPEELSALPLLCWNVYLRGCTMDVAWCFGYNSSANKKWYGFTITHYACLPKATCCANCSKRSLGNPLEKVAEGNLVKLCSLDSLIRPNLLSNNLFLTCVHILVIWPFHLIQGREQFGKSDGLLSWLILCSLPWLPLPSTLEEQSLSVDQG